MIEVTPTAAKKISAYLSENKLPSAIRIVPRKHCGRPSLGLIISDRQEDDLVYSDNDFTMLIDPHFSGICGKVVVDYVCTSAGCGCGDDGFSITSENPLPDQGCDCGSACSSGGCGC